MQLGSRWRHVRRGSTYEVRGRAKLQIGPETLVRAVPGLTLEYAAQICDALERLSLVDYVSESDGSAWFRPETEFADGRFVPVPEGYYLTRYDRDSSARLYYRSGAERGWTKIRDEATLYSDQEFAVRDRRFAFSLELRPQIEIRHTRDK